MYEDSLNAKPFYNYESKDKINAIILIRAVVENKTIVLSKSQYRNKKYNHFIIRCMMYCTLKKVDVLKAV